MEEQLRRAERMQAAGRLAGGVAHEVNNMMTGVIGFSEFLLRSLDAADERRTEVHEIIRAGTRAADVTRQLLAFTRQQYLRPEVLAMNAVVYDHEKMLRRVLGEDHLLDLALSPDAGEIRADRGQLEQVLVNLLLNARDAMPARGRVTIQIRTRKGWKTIGRAKLSKKSAFRLLRTVKHGKHKFRALTTADSKHLAGKSRVVSARS